MIVLGALPALALLLIWLRLVSSRGWREALVAAAVVWGVLVVVSTEALGLIGQFRFPYVAAFWVVASSIAAAAVVKGGRIGLRPIKLPPTPAFLIRAFPFAVIAAPTLLVALVAPPNTWDSMTYHLARVAHWVDQGSVAHYPTETIRQLYLPPFAEYAIAHFQILTGGDHLANVVQWSCMVGSVIGVSLIAQELGSPIRGQYLAAALAATLPMGILQSASTQNDYVESFWLVCAVIYALRLRQGADIETTLGVAASIGFAVLTKGTAYVFAVPVLFVAAWWLISQKGISAWRHALLMVLVVITINAGAWGRNISTFGSPLGPSQGVANAVFSAPAFASNIIRDTSNQLVTPFAIVNSSIQEAIVQIHGPLGISPNDPRTTWPGESFHIARFSRNEDTAADPVQFLLLLAAAVISFIYWRRRKDYAVYMGGLILAFLLFAFVLRWQPWHSRLELPLMVLGAPATAAVLTAVLSPRVIAATAAVLFVFAVPWLDSDSKRPLVGPQSVLTSARNDVYFRVRPGDEAAYLQAADQAHLSGCHVVGIAGNEQSGEYGLWVYLGSGYRVVAVHPAPGTENLGGGTPPPCIVFVAPS